MNLPVWAVRERSEQELQEMVNTFMKDRHIPSDIMELMLHKVLSYVQTIKAYDYANLRIAESEQKEQQEQKKGDTDAEGV